MTVTNGQAATETGAQTTRRPPPGPASDRPEAALRLVRDLAHGRWKGEVLLTVLQLELAEALGGEARPVADLAVATGCPPDALSRLLYLAAALGLCEATGEGAFRANEATAILRAGHGQSMRAESLHVLSGWGRIAWANLEDSVRNAHSGFEAATAATVFEYLGSHPEENAAFHAFQGNVTRRNAASLVGAGVLPDHGTIVDVGGGNGTLMTAVLDAIPDASGVVFDRAGTDRLQVDRSVAARLDWRVGDFLALDGASEIPHGAAMYLLSHVLHDWQDDDALRILRNVARAMAPDSRLLILENVKEPGTQNLLINYLDMLMLAAWGSKERSVAGYRGLLKAADLQLVSTKLLQPPTGLTALTAQVAT